MSSQRLTASALIAGAAALSGCGGDGAINSASSNPGPVFLTSQTIVSRAALPPTVATTAGTYGTVAWMSDQTYNGNGAPGAKSSKMLDALAIRIEVDPASHAFTVRSQLPDGDIERTYVGSGNGTNSHYDDFGYEIDLVYNFSDGTKSDVQRQIIEQFVAAEKLQKSPETYENSEFRTQIGLRYVSLGEWILNDFATDQAGTRQTRGRTAEFVYGMRTDPSDLPADGKATYRDAQGVLELDADFGAGTIAADVNYPAKIIESGDDYGQIFKEVQVGVQASGSSSITPAADFVIPLTGSSITPDVAGMLPDVIEPVSGSFTGAFFGPQAAEAGGIAEIVKANGDPLWAATPFLLEQK